MTLARQYGVLKRFSKVAALVFAGAVAAQAEEISVLALGDSLTQGYGLVQGSGFVPQLEGWLKDQGADVRVINAGVSGDTTAGGAARIGWALSEDVDAMIVALGANDMLRGVDPASSKANLAQILQVASDQQIAVLLIGMQAAGNYGPDYKAQFDNMYPELAAEFDTLHMESFFEALGSIDPAEVQDLMQGDGIHPNAEGVRLIVESVGPHVVSLIGQVQAN